MTELLGCKPTDNPAGLPPKTVAVNVTVNPSALAVTLALPIPEGSCHPETFAIPLASVVTVTMLPEFEPLLTVPPSEPTLNAMPIPETGLPLPSLSTTAGSDALATWAEIVSLIEVGLTAVSDAG